LEHYLIAEATVLAALTGWGSAPHPPDNTPPLKGTLLLFEIPSDFPAIKVVDLTLARDWRFYSREVFEDAFKSGYLVTDFIRDKDRSFYVLTHADSTLQDDRGIE
jgi:predicted GNAT superfamily acetyltransferase